MSTVDPNRIWTTGHAVTTIDFSFLFLPFHSACSHSPFLLMLTCPPCCLTFGHIPRLLHLLAYPPCSFSFHCLHHHMSHHPTCITPDLDPWPWMHVGHPCHVYLVHIITL